MSDLRSRYLRVLDTAVEFGQLSHKEALSLLADFDGRDRADRIESR